MTGRRLALPALIALWLTSTAFGTAGSAFAAQVTSSRTVSPLQTGRLEFGLSNLDQTWMTSSGVPWKYRFQYLAGGVNTSGNWLTWQDPAKPPAIGIPREGNSER